MQILKLRKCEICVTFFEVQIKLHNSSHLYHPKWDQINKVHEIGWNQMKTKQKVSQNLY